MAENLSNTPHPLANSGVSQQQRSLAAQSPDHARIDERSEADLLEYVFQLARTVVYQEVQDDQVQKSDWQDFFRLSVPIQLALIARFDTAALRTGFQETLLQFQAGLSRGDVEPVFSAVFDLARLLNRWHQNFSDASPLKTELGNLITNDLRFSFSQLVALANEAELKLGADVYRRPQNLQAFTFNPVWQFSGSQLLWSGMPVSATAAQAKGTTDDKKRFYISRVEALFQVFVQGVQRMVNLAQNTTIQQQSVDAIASHQPHIGLLLTFTRLFKHLQDDLNSLGEKQLDFYLRQVLCLQPAAAVPDQAHLLVSLDKQVTKHKIAHKTGFKASGKDNNGQEIHFRTDAETVLNQAEVVSLRTLYRDTGVETEKGTPAPAGTPLKRIRVASHANSIDGKGLPFEDPAAATWKTLGSVRPKKPGMFNTAGRIGFLLASPTLLLNEGNGVIRVNITFNGNVPTSVYPTLFHIQYSGKKGWVAAVNPVVSYSGNVLSLDFSIAPGGEPLTFADPAALGADFGGITDPMLQVTLNQADTPDNWAAYDAFLALRITDIQLSVTANRVRNLLLSNDEGALDPNKPFLPFGALPHVGSDFIVGSEEAFRKNLRVVNLHVVWDKLPATQSFYNYYKWYDGAAPIVPRPQNADFKADLSFLKDGQWVKGLSEPGGTPPMALPFQLFGTNNAVPPPAAAVFEIDQQLEVPSRVTEPLQPYSIASQSGFVKLSLAGTDFRHGLYATILAARMAEIAGSGFSPASLAALQAQLGIASSEVAGASSDAVAAEATLNTFSGIIVPTVVANAQISSADSSVSNAISHIATAGASIGSAQSLLSNVTAMELPNTPYTPLIKEFHLSYTAENNWSATGDITLLHLHPFETQNHEKQLAGVPAPLLPVFEEEGTLYLGLKNLTPGASLNLLFQMAEATANPDVQPFSALNVPDLPDWQYLRGNSWQTLRNGLDVRHDATRGLIASGIVTLNIPFDISSAGATILPSDMHWLRVSYRRGVAGVSESVAVAAQAVLATFDLRKAPDGKLLNDTQRLVDALPEGSISKPLVDDAALKKTTQPYPSFGGRPKEEATTFRRRAGEHLRHKGRCITLYDYEHLVLDKFPEVFKVKCLTHTHVFKNALGQTRDFYIAPGHVSLAVVPDISRFGFAEKLRPCASRALLQRIENFVRQRCSPFVKIHAVNPVYQLVDIDVTVVLHPDHDPAFYKEALAADILRFMTPWAFGENARLAFGGKLYQSSVLQFIENLEYIHYIVSMNLLDTGTAKSGNMVVLPHTERSIIAPGQITITIADKCPPENTGTGKTGLGYDILNHTLHING
jgi:hypothetical protein